MQPVGWRKSTVTSPKIPYDNYPTKPSLAKALVARVLKRMGDISTTHSLIEPSAGNGVFVKEMRAVWPTAPIVAVEVRPNEQEILAAGANQVITSDWTAWIKYAKDFYANQGKPVVIIGNPPFSLAQEHIEAAFENLPTDSTISFLLRFSFLGTKKRVPFWAGNGGKFLEILEPIVPRPSFVKGSQDNSEYALFNWKKGFNQPTVLGDAILWEKRNVRPPK